MPSHGEKKKLRTEKIMFLSRLICRAFLIASFFSLEMHVFFYYLSYIFYLDEKAVYTQWDNLCHAALMAEMGKSVFKRVRYNVD